MNHFLRRQWYGIKKIIWIIFASFELLILMFLLSQNTMIPIGFTISLGVIFLGVTCFIGLVFTTNFCRKYFCKEEVKAKVLECYTIRNHDDGFTSIRYLITFEYFYKKKKYIQIIEGFQYKTEDTIETIKICKHFPKFIYMIEENKKEKKTEYAFK